MLYLVDNNVQMRWWGCTLMQAIRRHLVSLILELKGYSICRDAFDIELGLWASMRLGSSTGQVAQYYLGE